MGSGIGLRLAGPLRGPLRPILLAPVVATVLVVALLPNCFFGGSCSDEDRQMAERLDHYGDAQLELFDAEGGGCAAVLEVRADVADVVDHYRRTLEGDDWDVSVRETLVEGPEGESAPELIARRGDSEVTIAFETFEGQVSGAIRVDA